MKKKKSKFIAQGVFLPKIDLMRYTKLEVTVASMDDIQKDPLVASMDMIPKIEMAVLRNIRGAA
jgi:hypothetical protein